MISYTVISQDNEFTHMLHAFAPLGWTLISSTVHCNLHLGTLYNSMLYCYSPIMTLLDIVNCACVTVHYTIYITVRISCTAQNYSQIVTVCFIAIVFYYCLSTTLWYILSMSVFSIKVCHHIPCAPIYRTFSFSKKPGKLGYYTVLC